MTVYEYGVWLRAKVIEIAQNESLYRTFGIE